MVQKGSTRFFLALMIKIILLPVTLEQWTTFAFFFFFFVPKPEKFST